MDARISCGQHSSKKLLHTFGSLNFNVNRSPSPGHRNQSINMERENFKTIQILSKFKVNQKNVLLQMQKQIKWHSTSLFLYNLLSTLAYKSNNIKYIHSSLTISRCSHELVEHSSHLIRCRHIYNWIIFFFFCFQKQQNVLRRKLYLLQLMKLSVLRNNFES